MARPSLYSPELVNEICELVATTPRGLDFICNSNEDFPSPRTAHNWLNLYPEFLQSYLRAKERQADLIFDECLEIADDSGADAVIDEKTGQIKVDGEVVSRARLRVDTRMRMAGKLSPKKYGESQQIKHANADGTGDLKVEHITRTVIDVGLAGKGAADNAG